MKMLWGVDADVVATLCSLRLELSSRLFRPPASGAQPETHPGTEFTAHDAIADTALVHRLTAITPEVGLHWPADRLDDPASLAAHATAAGVRIGSLYPDVAGRPGRPLPLCASDSERAEQALVLVRRAAALATGLGVRRFVLRWRDSGPYPGAAETIRRRSRLTEVLAGLRRQLSPEHALVVEYSVDESSVVRRPGPDWQAAHALATGAGQGVKVLLDPGSIDAAADAELSLTTLRSADRLAAITLDDLPWGDQPFALFLAMIDAADGGVLVRGRRCLLPFLLDLPPGRLPNTEATLRAVGAVLEAAARAMLLDRAAWRTAQAAGDLAAANGVLLDAYEADPAPLLTAVRAALGVPADPLASYREICRETHRAVERQRSVLRAELRQDVAEPGAPADAVAAEALVRASASGLDVGDAGGAGGRVVASDRWPVRNRGLRGVS